MKKKGFTILFFLYLLFTLILILLDIFVIYPTKPLPTTLASFTGTVIGKLIVILGLCGIMILFGSVAKKRFIGFEKSALIVFLFTLFIMGTQAYAFFQ